MDNPDMNNANATQKPEKHPIATMSWVILLIGLAAIVFAIYSAQNKPEEAPIETITREGVVTQIQQLNRLHTCLLYTSPSPRDRQKSRMPSSA
jgi:hypothetical protein